MGHQNIHFKKTRIAPTPSGYLHLGNVLSFAITACLARQSGAKILLRIDDLDRARVKNLYVQDIFDTLDFMEIPWDEGPRNVKEFEQEWSQSLRMGNYNAALQKLKNNGHLFACTCSRAQLGGEIYPGTCRGGIIPLDTQDCCWRVRTDKDAILTVKILQGDIKTNLPAQMHDFIVRKKNEYPSYQLASLIDDFYFGVDLIVRGNDLWPSTIAQIYLSQLIDKNFEQVKFYHHPLLMAAANKKLSKSSGDTSIRKLRLDGKKPAWIYAEIARNYGVAKQANTWQELGGIFLNTFGAKHF